MTTAISIDAPTRDLQMIGRRPATRAVPAPVADQAGLRDIRQLLDGYRPIGLEEMDGVALLNRTDTKYVLSTDQLIAAISRLSPSYRVLEAAGTRVSRYRSIYFDTEDFRLYRDHHCGRRIRYKLRSRQYVDSGISFLEVKGKGNRDRTIKRRIKTDGLAAEWPVESGRCICPEFLAGEAPLEPKLENQFYRITLVGVDNPERVTLDLDLLFFAEGRIAVLPQIAIAEVKQDGVNRESGFVQQMRAAEIRPGGFSKYCVGVAMLYDNLKHNQFRPQMRLIDRLSRG